MSDVMEAVPPKELLEWARGAEIGTLIDLLERSVRVHGTRPMLTCRQGDAWVSETYEEVHRKVRRLGRGLVALGIAAGDRVAQVSPNRPEWVIADLAILLAAAVHVPIYPTLSAAQMAHLLDDCRARVIFVGGAEQAETVLEAVATARHRVEHVVLHDDDLRRRVSVSAGGPRLLVPRRVACPGRPAGDRGGGGTVRAEGEHRCHDRGQHRVHVGHHGRPPGEQCSCTATSPPTLHV